VKPFAFSELLARVNALGRRMPVQDQKTVLRIADLELHPSRPEGRSEAHANAL